MKRRGTHARNFRLVICRSHLGGTGRKRGINLRPDFSPRGSRTQNTAAPHASHLSVSSQCHARLEAFFWRDLACSGERSGAPGLSSSCGILLFVLLDIHICFYSCIWSVSLLSVFFVKLIRFACFFFLFSFSCLCIHIQLLLTSLSFCPFFSFCNFVNFNCIYFLVSFRYIFSLFVCASVSNHPEGKVFCICIFISILVNFTAFYVFV